MNRSPCLPASGGSLSEPVLSIVEGGFIPPGYTKGFDKFSPNGPSEPLALPARLRRELVEACPEHRRRGLRAAAEKTKGFDKLSPNGTP